MHIFVKLFFFPFCQFKDPFFQQQISKELLVQSIPSGGNEQPSMIKQQQVNNHVVDPNINSQFANLKEQNDHLFMCKKSLKTVYNFNI